MLWFYFLWCLFEFFVIRSILKAADDLNMCFLDSSKTSYLLETSQNSLEYFFFFLYNIVTFRFTLILLKSSYGTFCFETGWGRHARMRKRLCAKRSPKALWPTIRKRNLWMIWSSSIIWWRGTIYFLNHKNIFCNVRILFYNLCVGVTRRRGTNCPN